MGAENFNRQFILLDFADLDNPDFLSFTRSPEFSTYLVMRRHVWRSAEPHYMGLHDYYAKGYLACSLEREKIAALLGISLVSISSDIQALQRRTVIESLRTGRQNIFVLGRWVEDEGASYEHFYLDRLYVRSKENLISELLVGRDKENFTSDDKKTRSSDHKLSLRNNRESNREENKEKNREIPVEISRTRKVSTSQKVQGMITDYVEDLAREFNDEATLAASVARAVNLYDRAGLDLDAYIEAITAARASTKVHSVNIQKQSTRGGGAFGPAKNRMAYFFAVLEDVLGLAERPGRKGGER
jgi:hypothetical protein